MSEQEQEQERRARGSRSAGPDEELPLEMHRLDTEARAPPAGERSARAAPHRTPRFQTRTQERPQPRAANQNWSYKKLKQTLQVVVAGPRVRKGSLPTVSYRTGAGKKKVPALLQRWNVRGIAGRWWYGHGRKRVCTLCGFVIALVQQDELQTA